MQVDTRHNLLAQMKDLNDRVAGTPTQRLLLYAAAALLLVFGITWLWVETQHTFPGEIWIFEQLREAWGEGRGLQSITELMIVLGTGAVAGLTVAIGALILWRNVSGWAAAGLLVAAAAVIPSALFQELIGPTVAQVAKFGATATPNFPSGHTVYATAVFGYLAVVGWRTGRREVTAVMVLLVLLMGPASVMSTAHQVSDVIAGYAIGGAWLCMLLAVASRIRGVLDL